jgi:hypothetical protein
LLYVSCTAIDAFTLKNFGDVSGGLECQRNLDIGNDAGGIVDTFAAGVLLDANDTDRRKRLFLRLTFAAAAGRKCVCGDTKKRRSAWVSISCGHA